MAKYNTDANKNQKKKLNNNDNNKFINWNMVIGEKTEAEEQLEKKEKAFRIMTSQYIQRIDNGKNGIRYNYPEIFFLVRNFFCH